MKAGPTQSPQNPDGSKRITSVLEDVIRRRSAGEAVLDQDVIEAHPKLAAELKERLRALRSVEEAERRARSDPGPRPHSPSVGLVTAAGPPGDWLADSVPGCQIVEEIHRGGQGVVYRARQEATGRDVAIKVMREGPFLGPRDKARFDREVRILGQLKHPNIVAIHDSGTAAGCHYFVMDYIRGEPLDAYIAARKLSVRESLQLLLKICRAVNAAHLRGVIHRDLKPGNIRVDEHGEPHILDFGLAKMATEDITDATRWRDMTMTGQFVGSLPWASPEQAEGPSQRIDLRTDVYSLGVILYCTLTGKFPYPVVGNVRDVLSNIIEVDPARPSSICRDIDEDVETIVLKCLAKEGDRRYQSAGELARDIEHYLAGEPIEARRDSKWYVLRKTLLCHKVSVAVVSAFLLLAITSAIGLGILYRKADAERILAERQAEALRHSAYFNNIALAQNAYEDGNAPQLVSLLEGCPGDLRDWEWRYLKRLSDTSAMTLRGHRDTVESVTFSPDGARFASGSLDGTIKVWNATTGDEMHTLTGYDGWNTSITFSPDGTRLAGADDDRRSLRIWDAETGVSLHILTGHDDLVGTCSFSPDGSRIATGSFDKTVKIWDIQAGQVLALLRGHQENVSGVAWLPDGERIVSAGWDGTVKVWDVGTGRALRTMVHDDRVVDLAVDREGAAVASLSWDLTARVWDPDSGALLQKIVYGTALGHGIAFSPAGDRLAVATAEPSVKVWHWETGHFEAVRLGHLDIVRTVAYAPDGRTMASGSNDAAIKIWRRESGRGPPVLRGHTDFVRGVAVSQDGRRIISAGRGQTVRVWDVQSASELMVLRGHTAEVAAVAVSSDDSRIISCALDHTIRVWNGSNGALITVLQTHDTRVYRVAFSPDDRLIASGSGDGRVTIWDAKTGKPLRTLAGHADSVYEVAFSPNGKWIVSAGEDGMVKMWDVETGRRDWEVRGDPIATNAAAVSPDGELIASGGSDRTIRLWEADTGRLLRELKGHRSFVQSLAFSPDGKRLVSGGFDNLINVWEVNGGRLLLTFSEHGGGVVDLAFSPDGQWFVSASNDQTLRIWDAGPGH